MTGQNQSNTVGQLPNTSNSTPLVPVVFTRLVWALWVTSLGALAARLRTGGGWSIQGLLAVDGLTVVMWVVVTFFSGIVHSYSRRYMAGNRDITRFFTRVFAFTLVVMVLVAADHVALFTVAWLAMGLLMAGLIGHVRGWPQARAAASMARRWFVASSALVGVALGALWWTTGSTTVSGIVTNVDATTGTVYPVAATALLLAAMIQSALVPFHNWLLSSMTAPTPASALMHAGFVNAGGILLTRFAPVVSIEPTLVLLIVVVGATSALLGKLLKSVQADVKTRLGCSTVGQMGFMLMQAGLGFFGAAITHLILHGFYKAYLFLGAGEEVEHVSPDNVTHEASSTGVVGWLVTGPSALAGGAVFAYLTGKGTHLDSGLVLTVVVVVAVLHASRYMLEGTRFPLWLRHLALPLVFLGSTAIYALILNGASTLLASVPYAESPMEFTVFHGILTLLFLGLYFVTDLKLFKQYERLYVWILNSGQPHPATIVSAKEEYHVHEKA